MKLRKRIIQNSSTLLSFLGGAGVIATSVLSVKATIKAMDFVYTNMRWEDDEHKVHYEPKKEIVKAVWKEYIPPTIFGLSTIACIFGANALNKKKQAILVSAYALLDRTYKEYKAKVIDILGEEEEKKVSDAIADDNLSKVKHKPIPEHHLFYEPYYGQAVERTMLEVLDAEYRLNQKLAVEGEASLNDFYEYLGLSKTDTGYLIGWSQEMGDDCYNYRWIEFEHNLKVGIDGMEYYEINMPYPPTFGYSIPF